LADFQPAISRHVNVQHDEVWPLLCDFFQGRGAVINGNDLVSRVRKDFSPHVLGGYAVIGEQYLPGQKMSSDEGRYREGNLTSNLSQ
jgi:hypothetical protein